MSFIRILIVLSINLLSIYTLEDFLFFCFHFVQIWIRMD